MDMTQTAERFFEACETGQGWAACSPFCTADASFAAQAHALDGIATIADYAEWSAALCRRIPDASYIVKGFATDAARNTVLIYGVFSGTGSDGPFDADYVYAMTFAGDRISHLTKIWNDSYS